MSKYYTLVEVIQSLSNEETRGITFISRNQADKYVSYKCMYKKALEILYNLTIADVRSKHECIFQIKDNEQFIYTFWGCILGGIIPIPVTVGMNDEDRLKLFRIWEHCNNPFLISDRNTLTKLESYAQKKGYITLFNKIKKNNLIIDELLHADNMTTITYPKPFDITFVQYSSGSTGNPKGVVLTHENLLINIYAILESFKGTHHDSILNWLPLTHDMGLIGFHLVSCVQKMNQYLLSLPSFLISPQLWLEKASEYNVTILSSTNYGLYHFINSIKEKDLLDLDLSCIRLIFLGAELISSSLTDKFIKITKSSSLSNTVLFPVYGLAEATLAVTFPEPGTRINKISVNRNVLKIGSKIHTIDEQANEAVTFVSVGTPIQDCNMRICDNDNRVLDENKIGHIQIKGKNVTEKYYNNEGETALAFTNDGWLKTGDTGFLHDRNLFVTGRIKDIIILNGQNYYLSDIDRIVEELPQIKKGQIVSVCVSEKKLQLDSLILFIIYKKSDLEIFYYLMIEIQKYFFSRIGLEFSYIIPINRIPVTTSGKVMRFKLVERYNSGEFREVIDELEIIKKTQNREKENNPELSTVEMHIIHILKKLFNLTSIHPENNFFELGGDSFKAGMLVSSLNKEFNVKIKLDDLFYYPSIRDLGQYIETLQKSSFKEIPKAEHKQYYCLSPAQKRMFILNELLENKTAYNLLIAFKIKGIPDNSKIKEVFLKIIKRHESLRTRFIYVNGIPMQVIQKKINLQFHIFNVTNEYTSEVIYDRIKEFKKPFDFNSEELLIRVGVIILPGNEYLLVLCTHHIITDEISITVLLKEFAVFYQNLSLPYPKVQYKDYSEWFQIILQTEKRMKEKENYWLNQFEDGIPVLNLPTDYPRPLEKNLNGSSVFYLLDNKLSSEIQNFTRHQKATLFIVLLTCYYILLYKYTHQEDVVVGIPVSGRQHPDLHNMIGLLVNTLCIRNKPVGKKSFVNFLDEVKNSVLQALNNQEYQFETLVDNLNVKRISNRNPIFDTMFSFHKIEIDISDITGLDIACYPLENDTSLFDILFHVFENKNGMEFRIDYSTLLFKKNTIETLIKHYIKILQSVINDPDILISRIDINTEKDRNTLIYDFNATHMHIPGKMIQSLFEEQVEKTPDTIAVVCQDGDITYKELNDKSNQIAVLLRDKGFGINDIIGLMISRTVELLIGLMAILKAGGAYLPIELSLPVDRINFMLKDCNTKLLLARKEIWEKDKYNKIEVNEILYIDDPELYKKKQDNLPVINDFSDPAYVIYTSGTTGKPKGVIIDHKNVLTLIYGVKEKVFDYFNEKLRICMVAAITFDVSVLQIFSTLSLGHTLYIMPDAIKKESTKIIDFYIKNNIDISDATPTFLQFLLKGLKQKNIFLPVKYIISAGEILPTQTVLDFLEYIQPESSKIANSYGPTECCVISTFYEINPTTLAHYNSIPIGKPLPNEKVYILDYDHNITPVGIPGEIYISGDGVGKEYINQKRLTDVNFLPDPFVKNQRMYKTGDWARWLPDGNIEFLNRIDKQVKIRGYRIEPEEIEIAIREHPGINDVVVLAKEFFPGDKRLAAYILTNFLIYWDDMHYFLERKISKHTCRRSEFRVQYQSPSTLIKKDGTKYQTQTIDISYHGIALKRKNISIKENEEVSLVIILPYQINMRVKAINTYHTDKTIILTFHLNTEEEDIIKKAVDYIARELNRIVFDFRRSEYRIPINGKCVVKNNTGKVIEVSIRDLSHSGISLLAFPEDFITGGDLELTLTLEKSLKPIHIKGITVWQTEKEVGIKFRDTRNYFIHMEFENHIQHRKLTVRDLQQFLAKKLPDYMIPSIFIMIDSIPFTKSGKIDFNALPEPYLGKIKGSMYEPPVTDIENKLIKIWQDILGIQKIGINDNFFEIGGDSLKALQVALALQNEYHIDINDIISGQTISQLVRRITPREQKTKEFLQNLYTEYERTLNEYNKRNQHANSNLNYFYIDYDEKYKLLNLEKKKSYNGILITGATGYLGAHLSAELLTQTKSELFILVRGRNESDAETRLINTFNFYFQPGFYDIYKTRINIINGDLSREKIGLNNYEYNQLADSIDCIINSAAIVKHFGNVREFIDVNVKGPERLLYLTQKERKKDFYHISTMSVAFHEILDDKPVLFTEVKSNILHIFDNEYLRTKKESEKIVIDWRDMGVNTTVFRTGMLMFHSHTGQFQKNIDENAFYRFLGSLMKFKYIPDVSLKNLDFSFIDYVSKAIILLVTRANLENEVFHIFNPNKISLIDFVHLLYKIDITINVLSFNDFLDFLIKSYKSKSLKNDIINIVYYLYIYVSIKSTNFILRSKKTEYLLKKIGFKWTRVTTDHIRKMVEYAQAVKYLE